MGWQCKLKSKNANRQGCFRARKADAGLKEVRGIYASKEHEKLIKEYAKTLANLNTKQFAPNINRC